MAKRHGRHRHHRHSVFYRIRRWVRHNKKLFAGFLAAILVAAAAIGGVIHIQQQNQRSRHVTAEHSYDMETGYRELTYNGKTYRYNAQIRTILYAGLDSQGKLEETVQYGNKARADSISLIVMDKKKKKMSIVAINRDAMTEIRRYTLSGKDRGTYVSHLGYAYSYGDGGKVSCESLVEAVSGLMGDIPVQEYVVTNQDSMPYINGLVDSVTVTVPNDDLAEQYPELRAGETATLNEENVYDYVHYRDTEVDFSNEGRMQRQQSYINAYIEKAKARIAEDPEGLWNDVQSMEDYLQTSITRNEYLNLVNLFGQVTYEPDNYWIVEGEDRLGELHDEFYVDKDVLFEKILDLFYEEI